MALRASRLRYLLAMGLPAATVAACGTSAPAPPPPPSPPAASTSVSVASAAASQAAPPLATATPSATVATAVIAPQLIVERPAGERCGIDTMREQICGVVGPPGEVSECGANGSNLSAYNHTTSAVLRAADYGANSRTFVPFLFDQSATTAYRTKMGSSEGGTYRVEQYCCYSLCTDLQLHQSGKPRPEPLQLGVGERSVERRYNQCIPESEGGSSRPVEGHDKCAQSLVLGGVMRPFKSAGNGACCYEIRRRELIPMPQPMRGRPLRLAGRPCVAEVQPGAAWLQEVAEQPTLTAPLRRRLHDAWIAEAQLEHASVAAFARLSLQLLALAAPPDLIDGSLAAARDEVAHARGAFSIAARFGEAAAMPAAFPQAGILHVDAEPLLVLRETLLDGCIGETIAAEEARRSAALAVQPELVAELAIIAEDEQRHAELGWALAAWIVRSFGPPAQAVVREVVVDLVSECARPLTHDEDCCSRETAAYGILCEHSRAALRREVLSEVVLPCLNALRAQPNAPQPSAGQQKASSTYSV